MCTICAELVLFAYANILIAFNLSEGFVCHESGRTVLRIAYWLTLRPLVKKTQRMLTRSDVAFRLRDGTPTRAKKKSR
jgi:hypothetical protein